MKDYIIEDNDTSFSWCFMKVKAKDADSCFRGISECFDRKPFGGYETKVLDIERKEDGSYIAHLRRAGTCE